MLFRTSNKKNCGQGESVYLFLFQDREGGTGTSCLGQYEAFDQSSNGGGDSYEHREDTETADNVEDDVASRCHFEFVRFFRGAFEWVPLRRVGRKKGRRLASAVVLYTDGIEKRIDMCCRKSG